MGKKKPDPATGARAVTFDTVREIARELPGTVRESLTARRHSG